MSKSKEVLLDNAANIVAIAPAILPAIEPITGGLLTLGTGFLTSVFSKRHYQFEKDLRKLTTDIKFAKFLQKLEEDEEYKSYFSEYIARNIQTPSTRARNAMVIICKRMVDGEETLNHFTKTAMNTLMQLSDEDIAVFLVATDEQFLRTLTLNDPNNTKCYKVEGELYPVLFMGNNIGKFALKCNLSAENTNTHFQRLIRFGALADEYNKGRAWGEAKYGINEYTRKLREVLLEEQQIFATSSHQA
jgi:hypothetical protein